VEASHMVRTALLMETLEAARVAAQIAVKENENPTYPLLYEVVMVGLLVCWILE